MKKYIGIILIFFVLGLICFRLYLHKPQYEKFNVENEYLNDFDLDANTTYFSTLDNKKQNVLLIWASWCPHCENVINYIIENKTIYSEYVFTVSIDESIEDIEKFQNDFPIYLDFNSKIYTSLNCKHVPTVFIVNSNGKILAKSEGEKSSILLLKEFEKYNFK